MSGVDEHVPHRSDSNNPPRPLEKRLIPREQAEVLKAQVAARYGLKPGEPVLSSERP
jgi:hypothetical protein